MNGLTVVIASTPILHVLKVNYKTCTTTTDPYFFRGFESCSSESSPVHSLGFVATHHSVCSVACPEETTSSHHSMQIQAVLQHSWCCLLRLIMLITQTSQHSMIILCNYKSCSIFTLPGHAPKSLHSMEKSNSGGLKTPNISIEL